MDKIDLKSLNIDELKDIFKQLNEKSFRAEQTFKWIHEKLVNSIDDITVFSKTLKDKLKSNYRISNIRVLKRFDSKIDKTSKYLFILEDDNIIESVLMNHPHGISICVSTQIGCRMGCEFCASTKGGLIRNLTSGEILDQIYKIQMDLGVKVNNIVLMGTGEPLDNYENVVKFLKIIHSEKGQNLGYRNIALSTCGIVPKIYELADELLPITLSISLHASSDMDRKKIMPISNSYKIDEILDACKYYVDKTNRRITFEYTLIKGINDTKKDALKLSKLLKGILCHVNLIPLNPVKEVNYRKSDDNYVIIFRNVLEENKINATIRKERGADINAACGQLRRDYLETGLDIM